MLSNNSSPTAPQPWPSISPGLGITDKGIVCGEVVILAHGTKGGGKSRMAPEADEDRLVALLSVMSGRPVAPVDVLHHVQAASAHWQRGEKALANFRLVFSGLPRPDDPAAVHLLRVAADILDDGLSPAALMKALWPEQADPLGKYAPDQPRVPAGNGARSGEWEFRGGGASTSRHDGRIVVASGDKKLLPEANSAEFDEITGHVAPKQGAEAAEALDPLDSLPVGIGPGPFAGRSIPAGPRARPTAAQSLEIDAIGRETGCHTCGTKDPGTSNGRFICDHQLPTALAKPGDEQYFFPHCAFCSPSQGGLVRAYKNYRR